MLAFEPLEMYCYKSQVSRSPVVIVGIISLCFTAFDEYSLLLGHISVLYI